MSIALSEPAAKEELAGAYQPSWHLARRPTKHASGADTYACVLVTADNWAPTAPEAERFHELFDRQCKRMGKAVSRRIAMDFGEVFYTYADLRDRANRLARFLKSFGVGPGSRVGLLLDRSIDLYAVILALSRLDAAYVPLDSSFPADRAAFILNDSVVDLVLSLRAYKDRFEGADAKLMLIDDFRTEITRFSPLHCSSDADGTDPDPLAYIIYTSGTTGQPKGVPVRQSQICNFLTVATHCYGYLSDDRVYQSLTVAFDFSFEEIWVPLLSGATLVPAPSQDRLAGEDLHDFLVANRITAMCVVPTLLATIEPNLPLLRMLMVSGEACPRDLIAPWFAKGRRILNAYGPTETTVTATWSVLSQDRPVTIGGPLPTYAIVIVDPDTGKAVDAAGVAGEICIAGQGVFDGYLNRPEQTARALTPDYIGMPDNPGGQLYRTGDLGQFTADNEVEYLGRIDTQVKIRGYRIELGEIEAVARAVDGVLQAVVEPYDADGDGLALVAYMTPEQADEQLDFTMIDTALRAALPAYMIPAYYEQLASLPMLASDKVNRRALPVPSSARFVASDAMYVAPYTEMQVQLAQLLADTLKVDRVSVEADFFKDLSADSLKLASYVTLIRKQLGIRRISMRKLYEHTSIAALALWLDAAKEKPSVSAAKAVLEETELPAAEGLQAAADAGAAVQTSASPVTDVLSSNIFQFTSPPSERTIEPEPKIGPQTERSGDQHRNTPHIPTRAARWATGLAQTMFYATAIFATFIGAVAGYEWSTAATRLPELYFRSVVSTTLLFFGTSAGLIAVKWLVIGRFTMEPIPVYSLNYLRFWIAQRSIRSNPMTLFIGTPMYATFLRLLGMSIGRDTVILSLPPVCTDLVSIGSHTAIRQDSVIQGYTSSNGYIYPGTVSIGSNVLICEATVLDINTVIGDGSHLGTTSSLLEGQQVPAGECWQGSPAEPSASRFDRVEPIASLTMRKLLYTVTSLSGLCLLSLPASIFGAVLLLQSGVSFTSLSIGTGLTGEVLGLGLGAAFIYFSGLLIAMFGVLVVPRILNLFIVPEVSHPVYGAQYELARAITRTSNSRLLNTIFGDSSMIVHWLSMVGYDLSKTTQTGSNFGVDQRHHSPFLCSFDRNTLVSDGLLMMNMETTSSAFRLRHVAMPPDTYVGNLVHYPADSRLGPNCLIATKAALPIDGPMRTDVGILGSPPFEIPRSVVRDQKFDHFKMPGILEQRLRMKLRSNLVTLGLYLLRSWLLTALGLGLTLLTFAYIGSSTVIETSLALTVSSVAFVVLAALFSIGFERNVSGFRRLQPRYCSLYDPLFWAHERFWKLNYNAFLLVFNGTPMKPFFLRLQGARVGSNVFDDGAGMTEPSMTSIGDDCTLNYRATMQCHSLEDGTFKSDRIRIGDRCTIGVSGFVHYGAAMQDDATLDADAFLMKGSLVEAGTRWLGNPARDDTDNAIFSRKSSKSIGAVS